MIEGVVGFDDVGHSKRNKAISCSIWLAASKCNTMNGATKHTPSPMIIQNISSHLLLASDYFLEVGRAQFLQHTSGLDSTLT